MHTTPMKMVVLVAEPVLEHRLAAELRELGAKGYSVLEGRGEGTRGTHATDVPGENIRIETIVPADVADRIMEYVAQHYFAHYSVIAFVHDVAVARTAKYA